VAQEINAAKKTAAEAAESAARREENESNADLIRQQAAAKFIENVRQLSGLDPIQETLAFAKILEENPEIAAQLDRIQDMLERLNLTRGVLVEQHRSAPSAIASNVEHPKESGA